MFDMEFVERGMKPSPPSPEAISAMDELGPGDYEIFSEKLNIICEEGKKVMSQMGISSMLHSGDTMAGVYTAEGDLVTAACGTYLHVVTGQVPVKFILKFFQEDDSVEVNEGDVFYCNEAIYGGIHNPDQFAIMPIFTARISRSPNTASSCAAMKSPGTQWMALTPRVFCAVSAVMTLAP